MTRTRLLTHTDLDGIGCAVIFRGVREGEVEMVENGAIDSRVLQLLEAVDGEILVTDHGVKLPTADEIDRFVAAGGSFTLLDHHRSSQELAGRSWATVNESKSATGLLFDHLGSPPAYAEFARLVEDHDLWKHEDPRSARLSALVGLLGHDRFLARFTGEPAVEFGEGELLLLDNEDARREDYLGKKLDQARLVELDGARWAVCYAEQYQSDLAERLMIRFGVEATAIVNPGKRTVSMRGRGVDVSQVGVRFGGGGHARAAAFTFRGRPLELELARFESALDAALASPPAP